MAKAQRYTMEQIQAAQKTLRGLASKNAGKTRAETVELLAADIRKAVEQGYSLNEIRDALAKAGIAAPLSRMKALLWQGEAELAQTGRALPESMAESSPETPVALTADKGKDTDRKSTVKTNYDDDLGSL